MLSETAQPRITLIGPVYPHRGGIAHYTACLARALADAGSEVQLISFLRLYPRWLFPGNTEFDSSEKPVAFPAQRLLTPLNPIRWLRALRAIGRFSPDLVVMAWWHSWFFPCTVFCLAWLRWIQRRRVVLLCHNIGSHDHALVDRLAWPILSRLPHAHLVHASDHPAQLRARNPRANVTCLPHPAYDLFADSPITREEARRRLGLEAGHEVCLFFGLVRKYKGVDVALEAAALLAGRPGLRLVVAGEFYDAAADYLRLVEKLGLGERVILHNRYVPNEEVAVYFRAADLLLAPYREASHSGVVQIARGFGLPAIATDVGGLKDLVLAGETGLLVPPADAKALAGAVAKFFDERLGDVFRRNLERQKERYSWATLAQTLRALARR